MRFLLIGAAVMLAGCSGGEPPSRGAVETSEALILPAPGEATEATKAANEKFGKDLPLSDRADFEDARRGFLGEIEGGIIKADDGRVVWDVARFGFLNGAAPATVNPSLWRQAQLNAIHGLFEVADGVYQLRGYDISVMTVIRGETGWIVVDPLLSKETARAAFALAEEKLGDLPVKAVLFTHSHSDHFGGIRGIVSDEDVAAGVRIIAPEGFAEEAVSENVLAGNAMARRARLQFGADLEAGPAGVVDSGIGKALSSGSIGFMQPTETVKETGDRLVIDGVEFVFINAPETEAPAEFMFYLPAKKALSTAELATGSLHNVLTLRGAKVRDALAWSKYLGDALVMFPDAEVAFASHNWPTFGRDKVRQYLERQRDIYRFINDQTLRLANQGYTMHEIAAEIGAPKFAREDFSVRDYYGTINHNSKATYQRYFGWWDGVPANLNPHPPEANARRYIELAGGGDNMIANAEKAFREGDYRWTATVMNHLVFAEPRNKRAKDLLAAAYEQLGFQSESAIWRNYYLAGAKELREGVAKPDGGELANPEFVKAISTAEYFDALAVRVNPAKASNVAINFVLTDTREVFGIRIRGGVETQLRSKLSDATATITTTRADLDDITLGRASFESKLAGGAITVDGNPLDFGKYLLSHDKFERWFDVVTP